jgi:hypothetical protein
MQQAILPSFLRHNHSEGLVRLGSEGDGGYIVSERDILASDFLLSLGVNDNWSFEKDFLRMKPVTLHAYDGSINFRIFFERFAMTLLRLPGPRTILNSLKIMWEYKKFFSDQRVHFQKFVGYISGKRYITIEEIFRACPSGNIFLKIDIEGFEYRVLDHLIKNQDRISGLVIEFHDIDLHWSRIADFVNRFHLRIIYLNVNNFVPLMKDQTPTVLEISFGANAVFTSDYQSYPHPLSRPNRHDQPMYEICFAE